jgi:DNA uptake protein ComE-like DNA-binding protein
MTSRSPNQDRGFALIIVLWLSLALAATALAFGHVALMGHRTQDGTRSVLQCRQTMRGAAAYVAALLGTAETGGMPEIESEDVERVVVGDSAFWLVSPDWNEGSEVTFGLVSEAGKLNLNTATKSMLQLLPGMSESVAAAIIDWRDENSEPEAYGAEDETYSRKTPSYRAKNGDFESVAELLLVDGVDEELLYGKDRNQNGVIDPWEDDDASADDADLGIWHLLTVYSAEPNGSSGGSESGGAGGSSSSSKTNVTQTQALRTYLTQKFGADAASKAANAGPYQSVLDFASRGGLTREQFEQVADDLTASDEDVVRGLVNVNLAPRAVLRCLPGIGDEWADKIISHRTANSEALTTVAWLLDALDADVIPVVGPYVTVKTYQFSADVVVVANLRRAVRRTQMVFDMQSGTPSLVSMRDLSGMPWPLGEDVWNDTVSEPFTDDTE